MNVQFQPTGMCDLKKGIDIFFYLNGSDDDIKKMQHCHKWGATLNPWGTTPYWLLKILLEVF